MKCQLIANLLHSGLPLEVLLSNLEKAREHIKHCEDCQEDKEIEEFLKKKIPNLSIMLKSSFST